MNDQQKKISEEKDAATAASQTSQVSKTIILQSHSLLLYFSMGLIILMVLYALLFSGHRKPVIAKKAVSSARRDYQAELRENLAKLKMSSSKTSERRTVTINNQEKSSVSKSLVSKQYIARQHAPTAMYSSAPPKNKRVKAKRTAVLAKKMAHPYDTIAAGEFIHAVLETAINSELQGRVRAVVSQPVYSYVGDRPLIPAGSRLLGEYQTATSQNQQRLHIIWQRIILPDGMAVQIDSLGVDDLGRSGQSANSIDRHFFERFSHASLLSIISAGVANYKVGMDDQYNSAAAYRMVIADAFKKSAQQSFKQSATIQPTLRIFQGTPINVFVAHDLSFETKGE